MKIVKLVLIFAFVFVVSCKMEPGHVSYTNALVYITEMSVPETGTANQPLNISAIAKEYTDCWSGLKISLSKSTNFKYVLTGTGNYNSYGTCNSTEISTDSTIVFTPTEAGEYIIATWISPYSVELDTIVVAAK